MRPSIVLLAFTVLLASPVALALEYTKAIPGKRFGLDYMGGGLVYEGNRSHPACQLPERLIQPGAGNLEVVNSFEAEGQSYRMSATFEPEDEVRYFQGDFTVLKSPPGEFNANYDNDFFHDLKLADGSPMGHASNFKRGSKVRFICSATDVESGKVNPCSLEEFEMILIRGCSGSNF